MRHRVSGTKLAGSKAARQALFRNLVGQLIAYGRIKTTEAKAKAIKSLIDKLVIQGKKATLARNREIFGFLPKETAKTFINTIIPQLSGRTSGFSRIIHLGERRGDNSTMVVMEWVDTIEIKNDPSTPFDSTQDKSLRAGKLKVQSEREEQKEKKATKTGKQVPKKKTVGRKRKVVEKKK